MAEKIEHRGIVERIEGNLVSARISQSTACSGCQARHLCNSSESQEKIVSAQTTETDLKIGEEVNVIAAESMGKKAVALAFVVPLVILVLLTFAAVLLLRWSEGMAIVAALVVVAAYYGVLAINRKKLNKEFNFWVERL